MLEWLEFIEKILSHNIVKLLDSGNVIIGGVGALTVSALTCWALYRTFMIMAGMSSEPLLPLIKDFLLKSFILTVATTSGLYFSFFTDQFIYAQTELSKSFIGSPYIMSEIGKSLDVALDGLTVATTDPKANNSGGSGFWGWLADTWNSFWDSVDFVLGGFFTHAVVILKLMIISLGLLYLALVGVMTVITSKIFLFIALGFGPLFVMFGAFETTRNWFWAWLSSTMGYFLTAVLVYAVWAFMMEIMKNHFFQPNGDEAITWVDCCRAFLSCFFFAKIMSRVGDLASGWFSAGNMTDSTNAMMVASGVAGTRGLATGSRVVGGVTAQTGRGIGRGARGLRNRASRTRVSNA